MNIFYKFFLFVFFAIILFNSLYASDSKTLETISIYLNIAQLVFCAILCFSMQAGFTLLEIGLTRAKNSISLIMKNILDYCLGFLGFILIGFGIMYGTSFGYFGTDHFLLENVNQNNYNAAFLFYQAMFSVTCATIVSGAIAERTKLWSYLIYTFIISSFIYPVFGSWAWGYKFNGTSWLHTLDTGAFCDFAGSTVVHVVGGTLAFIASLIVGPRLGKFDRSGNPLAIPGHNIIYVSIGVLLLWIGWLGFNSGNFASINTSISRVLLVTNISAISSALMAMFTSWFLFHRPEPSMTLNGILAGLVAITAGCNTITPLSAILVGMMTGVILIFSIIFIETILKIDDPVGAISVHGTSGIIGTIACGFFNAEKELGLADKSTGLFFGGNADQLISQLIGLGTAILWSLLTGGLLFFIIKHTIGLRMSEEDERLGLDYAQYGMESYHESR